MPRTSPPTGNEIRLKRQELGWSVELLAGKAGVSYKTVERIEAGDVKPRRSTMQVIESALATAQEAA